VVHDIHILLKNWFGMSHYCDDEKLRIFMYVLDSQVYRIMIFNGRSHCFA